MQNEANFSKSQMFITPISTTNYNEKCTLDTWSKQTQTKPNLICKNWLVLYWQVNGESDNLTNNQ
jgi:hypothetical protein